jgi:hypothetical protein
MIECNPWRPKKKKDNTQNNIRLFVRDEAFESKLVQLYWNRSFFFFACIRILSITRVHQMSLCHSATNNAKLNCIPAVADNMLCRVG